MISCLFLFFLSHPTFSLFWGGCMCVCIWCMDVFLMCVCVSSVCMRLAKAAPPLCLFFCVNMSYSPPFCLFLFLFALGKKGIGVNVAQKLFLFYPPHYLFLVLFVWLSVWLVGRFFSFATWHGMACSVLLDLVLFHHIISIMSITSVMSCHAVRCGAIQFNSIQFHWTGVVITWLQVGSINLSCPSVLPAILLFTPNLQLCRYTTIRLSTCPLLKPSLFPSSSSSALLFFVPLLALQLSLSPSL